MIKKDILILILVTIFTSLIIYLPHFLKINNFYGLDFSEGMNNIYRNYDGINYVIIAKTLYYPENLKSIPQSLPAEYFAAHFPGYSILLLITSPFLGHLKAMILIPFLFTILSVIAFYYLLKDFKLTSQPLFLSLLFLVLPARWLIVHTVGSAEPLFIFFTIVSLYFFLKYEQTTKYKFIWSCALFGALAQLTRPPGIILFLSLGLYLFYKTFFKEKTPNPFTQFLKAIYEYYPLTLIPLTLLLIFAYFGIAYQDFFAYFHSGDNIHLTFPPYQVFNIDQPWVGEIWLEDIIYIFLLGLLGGIFLVKQKLTPLAFFVFTYLSATILVAHRDISRYILPIFPFVLIAFEKVLISKEFKIALAILLPAIYLYTQNFLLNNTAPIPNLKYFD